MATELGVAFLSIVGETSKLISSAVKGAGDAAKPAAKAFSTGFGKNLGGVEKSFGDAGKRGGELMAKQALSAAKGDINKLSKQVSTAMDAQAAAAGRLRVAQAKLAEVQANGKAKASQLAAAEEAVASAQRKSIATTAAAEKATKGLAAAHDRATKAAHDLERAAEGAGDAGQKSGRSFNLGFSKQLPMLGGRVGTFFKTGLPTAAAAAGGLVLGGSLIAGVQEALGNEQSKAKLAAQLNLNPQQTAQIGKTAGDIFKQNYGDSLDGVNDAVRRVVQNTGTSLSSVDLSGITKKTLNLVSTFDQEANSVTRAAGQLVRNNLAPNVNAAMDIITVGFQKGVDSSDDFLDTLNEYGGQFRKLGVDGATATGILNQGLAAGARNGDLVADALKEFSIRAVDGSKTTATGFKAIGLNAEKMTAQIAKGGPAAREGLGVVLDRLRAMKDPAAQAQAAVALFGTQAEDLGSALYAINPTTAVKGLGQVAGAAERMDKVVGSPAQASITAYFRTIKQGAIDGLGAAIQGFRTGAEAGTGFNGAMSKLGVVVKGTLGFIVDNQAILLTIAGTILSIAAAVKIWTLAQAALNFVMTANPIGLVVLAIVGLVAALVIAYKRSETFRNIVNAVGNALKGAFLTAVAAVKVAIGAIVTSFNAVKAAVSAAIGFIVRVWSGIVAAVTGPIAVVVNVLQAIWSRVYPIIALPFFIAKKFITDFWAGVRVVFSAAAGWVTSVFSKAWGAVSRVLSGPINAAKTFIGKRIDDVKYSFTVVKDWAVGAFSKAWSGLTAKLTGPITTAKNAISTILGAGKGGLQWIFSQAVSGIGKAWDGLKELAKKPIRFIVDTVLNSGLIGAFNWVASKFEAPTIPTIPLPAGFASGGQFDGRLPGRPSSSDNMLGMTAAGPVGLATGEYIVNARDTARTLPILEHLNNGGDLPGFAKGGLFGSIKNAATKAFSAGKDLGADVLKVLEDPVKWFKERLTAPLARMSELGSSPTAEIVKAVPRRLVDTVSSKAKDLLGIGGGGGPINPGLAGALSWARSQVGKPYIWGGVGPAGYDCSGFMSAIVNVIKGKSPYSRLFATGSLPAGMFSPGNGAFNIGWFTGNPGHVAGTLNGVNVESRGGRGVVVGPGARGANDSLFNRRGHLTGYAKGGIVGDPPFDLLDPRGKNYTGKAVVPRSALSYDEGGLLPTGYSVVHNGTGKPEPVGHDFLRKDDLDGMRIELDAGGVGTLTGYMVVTAQDQIKESNRAIRRKVGR